MSKFVIICIVGATFFMSTHAAVSIAQVELGKPYSLDFGEGNFVIRRRTMSEKEPQYIFASPNQDGSWTTNGVDKIPSTAHLYFNGTLVFSQVAESDIGSYDLPLEKPRIVETNGGIGMVGPSQIDLQAAPPQPPMPIKDQKIDSPIA